jgi:radical SAM superfamily enzyme YgiQ (UPF0313 family)
MDNLGFQTVHKIINERNDTYCERVFFEKDKTKKGIYSLETGKSLPSFDLIAASISFEPDIINFLKILYQAKIPLTREERDSSRPFIIAGGIGVFPNPEPLSDFIDAFIIGEGEKVIDEFLNVYINEYIEKRNIKDKKFKTLIELNKIKGVYIPKFFTPHYNSDDSIKKINIHKKKTKIEKRYNCSLNFNTASCFLTPLSQFSNTFLIEIGRGCGRGCRFCLAGFAYRCPRFRTNKQIVPLIREALKHTDKIGLLGASLSDYKELNKLCAEILSQKGTFSLSSLRPDILTKKLIKYITKSGQKSITIAPETGSERLRKVINKNISDDIIYQKIKETAELGIKKIKLYFLIGLPTENEKDIDMTIQMIKNIKKKITSTGNIKLIINISPYIPKPWTPFQWVKMEEKKILKKRIEKIKKAVVKLKTTEIRTASIKEAVWQALISRGDRRTGIILKELVKADSYNTVLRKHKKYLEDIIYRSRLKEEIFPWDILDMGVSKDFLWKEYQKALKEKTTPPCPDERECGRCM